MQRQFILAIFLCVVVIYGWQAIFPPAKKTPPVQQAAQQVTKDPSGAQAPGAQQALAADAAADASAKVEAAPLLAASAEQDVKARLGKMQKLFLSPRPRRGWTEARVTAIATPLQGASNRVQVTMTVEPGPELAIVAKGLVPSGRNKGFVIDALDIDHRTRLTRGFVDRAPERIQQALQDRGRLQANVDVTLEKSDQYDVRASLKGGGITGQAGALRLAIARALIEIEPDDRPALKKAGFLTRDPRVTERKKYGLKKARKAPQYSKR